MARQILDSERPGGQAGPLQSQKSSLPWSRQSVRRQSRFLAYLPSWHNQLRLAVHCTRDAFRPWSHGSPSSARASSHSTFRVSRWMWHPPGPRQDEARSGGRSRRKEAWPLPSARTHRLPCCAHGSAGSPSVVSQRTLRLLPPGRGPGRGRRARGRSVRPCTRGRGPCRRCTRRSSGGLRGQASPSAAMVSSHSSVSPLWEHPWAPLQGTSTHAVGPPPGSRRRARLAEKSAVWRAAHQLVRHARTCRRARGGRGKRSFAHAVTTPHATDARNALHLNRSRLRWS